MRTLNTQYPLNHAFRNETQHPQGQHQKENKGAELASLGLQGQVKHDKHHVKNESTHAKGQAKLGDLAFGVAEKSDFHGVLWRAQAISGKADEGGRSVKSQ